MKGNMACTVLRRNDKKRAGMIVAVAGLCIALVFGAQAVFAAEQTKTLTLLVHGFDPWIRATADAFEKAHPDIKIEISVLSSIIDKLNVLIAAGTPPDMVLSNMSNRYEWFTQGAFLDLTPYIQRDQYQVNALLLPAVNALRYGNKQLGLPNDITVMGYFYSVDDYEEAGAAAPANLYKQHNWSTATFLNGARKTTRDTNGDGKIDRYGYSANLTYDGWIRHYLAVFGGGLISDDDQRILFDSAASQRAISYIASLNLEYRVAKMGTPYNDIASGAASAGHHFLDTPFRISSITNRRSFTLGATAPVLETADSSLRSVMIVNHWSIMAGAKYPNEAWEFMKYLLSDEYQTLMPSLVALWPARSTAMRKVLPGWQALLGTDAGFIMDVVNNADMTLFRTFPGYLRGTPGGISQAMINAVRAVWDGKESVSNAVTRAAETMRALLLQAKS